MDITKINKQDFEQFWPTFRKIVTARETYAIDPDIDFDEAYKIWCVRPHHSFVAKQNGAVTGCYYLKPNASGPGSHICNCGYMVDPRYRGKGIAKSLCIHSQHIAIESGYQAMQFNAVVSTNKVAIHVWKSLGFSVIGTIPNAYNHKQQGLVDAFIMYKPLTANPFT